MAGHSQFKNIMYRKGAQDKKRAKLFNKIAREITVAAREGMPDPDANPRLRAAMIAARQNNMPKDRIERAVKSGSPGGDDTQYDEMRYEGYAPGGIAIIVEALTDNRNRTASEVRSAFTKFGGNMGETGSVSFMFDRNGLIAYEGNKVTFDDLFMAASEAGADDVEENGEDYEVLTDPDAFGSVRDALEKEVGEPKEANLVWRPKSKLPPTSESAAVSLFKMMDLLEDNDDVQSVTVNADISQELAAKIAEQL